MIYINQDGYTELGRGNSIDEALAMARECGCEIEAAEIKTATESRVDGDCYWTDEPVDGYNDDDHIAAGERATGTQ